MEGEEFLVTLEHRRQRRDCLWPRGEPGGCAGGVGREERLPGLRVSSQPAGAELGHQRCSPGGALLGAREENDRRVEGIGNDLRQRRGLRETAGENDLAAGIALRREQIAAEF